ncbi:MAG: hypothetical protein H0Z33_02955 [Bacillaceae bacterium]|nr:hypothetical protein [Bacillaceae bacterium]
MALEESKRDRDVVEEVEGITLLIDESIAGQLNTINIEYYKSLFGRGNFSIYAV